MAATPPQTQPTFGSPEPIHDVLFDYDFEEGEDWFG
jgi:hypothetical protein